MGCSIFIPIFNEAQNIKKNVGRITSAAESLGWDHEIFIVDDNSTDGSPSRCRDICKKNGRVHYLRYGKGPTRRENLAQSFKKATKDTVLFIDSDLATDLRSLQPLADAIKDGADVSIGHRYLPASEPKRAFLRLAVSHLYNSLIRLFCGSHIRDHNCGFKAFRREAILDLVKLAGNDRTLTRGWFWDAEILIWAQRRGYSIRQIPVRWIEGAKSTVRLEREILLMGYFLRFLVRLHSASIQKRGLGRTFISKRGFT